MQNIEKNCLNKIPDEKEDTKKRTIQKKKNKK